MSGCVRGRHSEIRSLTLMSCLHMSDADHHSSRVLCHVFQCSPAGVFTEIHLIGTARKDLCRSLDFVRAEPQQLVVEVGLPSIMAIVCCPFTVSGCRVSR
jgi:hypothetical protein